MKSNQKLDIPDGEYLRYGNYLGGEKHYDLVFVTRKHISDKGKLSYYIYSEYVPVGEEDKVPKDYTQWRSFYVIDPELGSVLECTQTYSTDSEAMDNKAQYGMGDVFYTQYKLYEEKGYVEYITKSLVGDKDINNENNIKVSKYRLKIDGGQALWESAASIFFAPRFMDYESGGEMYVVVPQLIKNPLPNYYKLNERKTITVPAGTFQAIALEGVIADPFIGKLLGSVLKGGGYWVEENGNRRVLKVIRNDAGDASILEEISNILEH